MIRLKRKENTALSYHCLTRIRHLSATGVHLIKLARKLPKIFSNMRQCLQQTSYERPFIGILAHKISTICGSMASSLFSSYN